VFEKMEVPDQIVCVDCGQSAHRLTYPPEEGWEIGDYVAYRCSGCNDRWDLVVCEEDAGEASTNSFAAEARAILESRRDAQSES
jgi:DNA-directed RNA polymerase subunit RPC12/RpoP